MGMARNRPVTMEPMSIPPKATGPKPGIKPTITGDSTGIRAGIIISFRAALVTMSTQVPY